MKPKQKPNKKTKKKPIYKTINYTYMIYTDYGHSEYVCTLYKYTKSRIYLIDSLNWYFTIKVNTI